MPKQLIKATAKRLAEGVDRAFASTALAPSGRTKRNSSAEGLGHDARIAGLAMLEGFYDLAEHTDREGPFFTRPQAITPDLQRQRRFGRDGEVIDLQWRSAFEPFWAPEALAAALGDDADLAAAIERFGLDRSAALHDKYLSVGPNMVGHARWFHHRDQVRPCVVLLHGYLGGNYLLEERLWPVRRLFDGGLDVVLSILPFHGPRRDPRRGLRPPAFPSSDPRFTIEGMRHMVHDQRALFDYLREGRVASLGVMGMSLGGYSAALLATLEPLDFAVLYIPLAAIDRFAHEHGRMVGEADEQQAQAEALRRAHAVISPLSRPPLLPPERAIVIAGESDLVTGVEHSRMLADHFGSELTTFDGGHILQVGRDRAFEPVYEMLARAGLHAPS
ncbi:MAG: hypothetical protein OXT09_16140 [Myxococcales bacterium]|nr:hypothetical protein [Myxococcales bacterium]